MSGVALSTVKRWKNELDIPVAWIDCILSGNFVTEISCKLCMRHVDRLRGNRNFSMSFVNGIQGTSLKKDQLNKHKNSDMHKLALSFELNSVTDINKLYQTPIGQAFGKAKTGEEHRVIKLFDIAYGMAKEGIAFKKFSFITELEKRHGVDLGQTYQTEKMCREFTSIISNSLKSEMVKELNTSQYFTVMCDGSTDVSAIEKESIFVMHVNDTAEVNCNFYALRSVKHATATGIKECLLDSFTENSVDIYDKFIGFLSDGASVNLGKKSGLVALLKHEMDWVIGIHCLNHRLELAIKDAFKNTFIEETICEMLMRLYYFYENSPKKLRELKQLASVMEETIHKPGKAQGTRWVQHKARASKSLLQSYGIIMNHLESLASDPATAASTDKAKVKGYIKKMKSTSFVLHLIFFEAILNPVSKLSVSLQSDSLDLLHAQSLLHEFYAMCDSLLALPEEGQDESGIDLSAISTQLNDLVRSGLLDTGELTFKDIQLSDIGSGIRQFSNKVKQYITDILRCVKSRCEDLNVNKSIFSCLKLLDFTLYPNEDNDVLRKYGLDELNIFLKHFHTLLAKKDINNDDVIREFQIFKVFWQSNLRTLSVDQVLKSVTTGSRCHLFSSLKHVFLILRVFPASNAKVERSFSMMNIIKTDWRNQLSESTMDSLMRIKIDGPAPTDFCADNLVHEFFSMCKRRPSVEPYGPTSNTKKSKTVH